MNVESFLRFNKDLLDFEEIQIIDFCFESEKCFRIDSLKSLKSSQKAYDFSVERGFVIGLVFSSYNLAKINYYLGEYEKAKGFYEKAKNEVLQIPEFFT